MSRIVYPRTSPYAATGQTSWYLSNYKHQRIPRDSRDTLILLEARHQYRPDILSQELYDTPALWWVFMVRNMNSIRDPINDFVAGKSIFVPAHSHLKTVLGL